ncbi:MAG: peptidoglycan-binding domain-containing protein [bacterium]
MNKKQNRIACLLIILAVGFSLATSAKATSTASTTTQSALIATLQQQIQTMVSQLALVKQSQQDVKQTLKLARELKEGMSGNDVKLLQQILATDPSIYPQKIISGYFGKLTAKAVKKFKEKIASSTEEIDDVNDKDEKVNSRVLSRLNEILENGAGKSGKVPPGLLKAPGILKKLKPATTASSTPISNATTSNATTTP